MNLEKAMKIGQGIGATMMSIAGVLTYAGALAMERNILPVMDYFVLALGYGALFATGYILYCVSNPNYEPQVHTHKTE